MITVRVDDHGFGRRLPILLAKLQRPAALLAVLGRDANNQLKTHFRHKDRTEPNKLGGNRQHFWRAVTDSVHAPRVSAKGDTVLIAITHPAIAQKVFGGLIRPKRVKYLTIPVSPEAYGRTARTFEAEEGVKLVALRVGKGAGRTLVLASLRGGGIQVEYLLRSSVKQAPDADALPDIGAMSAALLRRAEHYVARILAQATGQST